MRVEFLLTFRKSYKKRIIQSSKLDRQFQVRLQLFLNNPKNPVLRAHKLKGTKKHLQSFSITGDVRVTYYKKGETIYLVDIGTHSQVY